jgi:hypothetical protein
MTAAMIWQCSHCKKEWDPTDAGAPWQDELCPFRHPNPTGWYRTRHLVSEVMVSIPDDLSDLG